MFSKDFLSEFVREFGSDRLVQDADRLQVLGRDWTEDFSPDPAGAFFPRSTGEVSRVLSLCSRHRIPVVPSGGRTGLSGGAVAARGELVLGLEKMNRLGPVDRLGRTVRVEAGARTAAVRAHCEPSGLTWPVRFGSDGTSCVGGNISTNAGGAHVVRYGSVRSWVLGLEVVLMDGQVLELNGALEKNNSGMALHHLFIGSEGILGVVTAATLKLAPLPSRRAVFFLGLKDVAAAARLFEKVRGGSPFLVNAFEMMEAPCVKLVRETHGIEPPCASGECFVLLELEADPGEERLVEWMGEWFERGWVLEGCLASSSREEATFWAIRENISEALAQRGMFHKNDVAVPVSRIVEFCGELHETFSRMYPDLQVYNFGHLGDGNLHINVVKPQEMERGAFLEKCKAADELLFRLLQPLGGTISAEHGIGLLKKPFLPLARSPREIELMHSVKAVFDPLGLLNPGKVVSSPNLYGSSTQGSKSP